MKRRDGQQEFRNAASRDPAALEREADAARDDLRRTLERLDQQFSPGQMIDRMVQRWRERDSQFATNLSRTVQANPAPVVLSSVGIGWLAFADNRQKHRPPSGGRNPSETASSAAQSAREAAGAASDRASNAADRARVRASEAASSLADQGERARQGFGRLQQEQPFLVGAIGVALGAALGGTLPSSRTDQAVAGAQGERAREATRRPDDATAGGASEAPSSAAAQAGEAQATRASGADPGGGATAPRSGQAGGETPAAGTGSTGSATSDRTHDPHTAAAAKSTQPHPGRQDKRASPTSQGSGGSDSAKS